MVQQQYHQRQDALVSVTTVTSRNVCEEKKTILLKLINEEWKSNYIPINSDKMLSGTNQLMIDFL